MEPESSHHTKMINPWPAPLNELTKDIVNLNTWEGVLRIVEKQVPRENPELLHSLIFYLYSTKPFIEQVFVKALKEAWKIDKGVRVET